MKMKEATYAFAAIVIILCTASTISEANGWMPLMQKEYAILLIGLTVIATIYFKIRYTETEIRNLQEMEKLLLSTKKIPNNR